MRILKKNAFGQSLISANWKNKFSENINIVILAWINFELTSATERTLNI